jgi:hypothetical protein
MLSLSRTSRRIAGLLLLSVTAIESGGYFLTRVSSGREELTEFQESFARAGHGHAGVLVILSLVAVILADAAGLSGVIGYVSRLAIPAAAILMPAGFFLSSSAPDATGPGGPVILLWAGAACLAIGVVTLGVGLLRSSMRPDPPVATAA